MPDMAIFKEYFRAAHEFTQRRHRKCYRNTPDSTSRSGEFAQTITDNFRVIGATEKRNPASPTLALDALDPAASSSAKPDIDPA
jgi:hypothetical protein